MSINLKNERNEPAVYDEGESGDIEITFKNGTKTIDKASLQSIVYTLYDVASLGIINGRDETDALDANDNTVTTAGVLTLRLSPLDNVVVDSSKVASEKEEHAVKVKWTWLDIEGVLRTGIADLVFNVLKLRAPVTTTSTTTTT